MNRGVALLVVAGVMAIAWPTFHRSHPRLIYNATASEPRGWYGLVHASNFRVGDIVLADLPAAAARLADSRGYLPSGIPILKRVGAVGGQRICARGQRLIVDENTTARVLATDAEGRPLATWSGCRRLREDELLLLNPAVESSFDSRYFGPVSQGAVGGRAVPLLTW